MTKPVTIPNTFATATTAIPLSNLDADFSTVATAMNDANTYSNYAADTGSANAYVVTLTGISAIYSAGLRIQFKAGNANTTASTLNVNAQGAKNITYQDASAIASGTIAANSIVDVMYDGTQFLLMNDPAGGTGGDVVGPASATDNAIVRFDGTTGKLVQNSVVTIADSTGDISGVGQLNATTVDTTNIEVTNIKAKDGTAAATIADSTGVVSITANPVLSGGTANGVLYLNGSKVATSGSALTFDGATFATTANVVQLKNIGELQWKDTTGTGQNILYMFNDNNVYLSSPVSGSSLIFRGAGYAEAMRLTSTGLGIGTSSPVGRLDVNTSISSTSVNTSLLNLKNTLSSGRSGAELFGISFQALDQTNGTTFTGAAIYALNPNVSGDYDSGALAFYTKSPGTYSAAPVERARITSGGYFKASNNGTYLDSAGTQHELRNTTDNGTVISTTDANQTSNSLQVEATRNTTNNTFYSISYYNRGAAAYKFRVADSGDVTNTNNSYAGISDLKLKQDIVDASSQWDDIKNLRVRKYRLKSDPSMPLHIGLVAQEAELVSPGLVDEHTDRDAENNDLGTKTKSVKYSILYMKAIKALQEAMARIETLEAKVAQLEGTQP